ncbi:NAD(P)/FAD-dependent oxidoreductase [bacterium]|nr:MAG: NAD(P)/FAD-dependent oxidoreductase [bacterium]
MDSFDYLIIGGGMTAAAAALGIRENDPTGTIAILGDEIHRPYDRPDLSKKLWLGKAEEKIWRKLPAENLTLRLGDPAAVIDPSRKQVTTAGGTVLGYHKLLLATGGMPRKLPFAPPEVVYFRTLDDYRTLRSWQGQGKRIGVIGGGFIGSEIAAALSINGEKAVMVFPEAGIGARLFPADLATFLNDYYSQKGVDVLHGLEIQAIDRHENGFILVSKDGQEVLVDHIVAGIGIRPNTALAQSAGVAIGGPETGGGILVDEHLRTNLEDIYAAGDVASFYETALQRWARVEHEDNAISMGKAAGASMAGSTAPYTHQSFFFSDLFDLGYEAVGEVDSRLETYADWVDPYRQGVIYYLRDNLVRGVLLWNTWGQLQPARDLIAAAQPLAPADLHGRLPVKENAES